MTTFSKRLMQWRLILAETGRGPQMLAFLPALSLAAFWIGGEAWLISVALILPLCAMLCGGFQPPSPADTTQRPTLSDLLKQRLGPLRDRNQRLGLFLIAIDSFEEIARHHGQATADRIEGRMLDRLRHAMRPGDEFLPLGDGKVAMVTAPVAQLDVEIAIQIARRLQSAIEAPITIDGTSLYLTCSIGFVLDRQLGTANSAEITEAGQAALDQALHHAPSAIRAFAPGMRSFASVKADQLGDVLTALENGAIEPWFQPQISTDTGAVTGVEALARWQKGGTTVPPAEFLPIIENNGLMGQLGDLMLTRSLMCLSQWDAAGFSVPQVGVNVSNTELRDPGFAEKVNWTLDRFDLSPNRLSIEILETVIAASPDDVVVQNIDRLSRLGCQIDLDDFGTGHASITALRRFAVNRIKIDRSFVTNLDHDPQQRRLVAAVLSMAEHLDLDSLAEGVETLGEHSMLAQLGCRHVQGFGIARPMPAAKTQDWIHEYESKREQLPEITRRRG